jgi:hypothetical protein
MNMTSTGTGNSHRRRPLLRFGATAAAGVLLAAIVPGLAGGAQSDFISGSGNAYAQIYRVGPTAARLSLAPVIGLSLADFQNTEGRGEATVADWAAIGVSTRELPDNTPTLRVVSTDKDADKGVTKFGTEACADPARCQLPSAPSGAFDGSGNGGGLMELFARATKAPLGESHIHLQSLNVSGIITLSGGEATTTAGVFDRPGGKLRISKATVTINGLDLGPVVKMTGLHWEAIQTTDANDKRSLKGTFTMQGASIAGVPIPIAADQSNLKAVFDAINTALAPIGFSVTAPIFDKEGGVADMGPLQFQIINSPLGRQYLAPILTQFREQDATKMLIDQYISLSKQLYDGSDQQIPDLTVGVLAADLTLGILSGASQLHIELGGANSYSEGELFASPFGPNDFRPPDVGPQSLTIPGIPGRPAIPGTTPTNDTGQLAAALPPAQKTIPGGKGGIALAVGFAGLAVALALASADWYRMRKYKRTAA